jgi:hypothetical protein
MTSKDRSSPQSGRLVQVFASSSISEGLLARGLLQSEGIPVMVKGEAEGPYRMGPVILLVPENLEVQARLILAEARSEPIADEDPVGPDDARVD